MAGAERHMRTEKARQGLGLYPGKGVEGSGESRTTTCNVGRMGPNDEFAMNLQFTSGYLAVNEEGLRVCILCERVHLWSAEECLHCIRISNRRILLFVMFVIGLAVAAMLAAWWVTLLPPPPRMMP